MINFLPPEAKTAIKREYLVRTGGVWALLVSAVALVGVALLFPTYVLLVRQLDALAIEGVRREDDTNVGAYQAARAALLTAQALVAQLRTVPRAPTASEVLHEIQGVQMNAILLSGFSYEHTGTTVETVEVRGVAATREALAEFSAALERNPLFARAQVPVSNLAEGRDLPFTLSITLANAHR